MSVSPHDLICDVGFYIHFTNKRKLEYYDGNYDQFVKTKSELEENQMKQCSWEQDQINSNLRQSTVSKYGHIVAVDIE